MITHFVTLEIPLADNPAELRRSILSALQQQGEPLRWAITGIETDRQIIQVEAVVLAATEFRPLVNPLINVRTV
ncbi:MAG TPA: hypothetical protein V6D10_05435 [Trichocoleus sp.]